MLPPLWPSAVCSRVNLYQLFNTVPTNCILPFLREMKLSSFSHALYEADERTGSHSGHLYLLYPTEPCHSTVCLQVLTPVSDRTLPQHSVSAGVNSCI
jgi:hypothetical protein